MTQTAQKQVFKGLLLKNTADMLKAAGLQVFVSVWENDSRPATYFHFTDGVNIGYCQEGRFGGIRFSTVHRPCKECGTGFGLQDDPGISSPTLEDAKQAFVIAPEWADHKDRAAVRKWANWEQFAADKERFCKVVGY